VPTARRDLTYPTDHLLGVIDDPARAAAAASALTSEGFKPGDVTILRGDEGMERLAPSEGVRGMWTKLVRAVQYTTMDQMPDFPAYVAALKDGRAVLAVHARSRRQVLIARDILERHGAHFLNFFGRYSTEEFSRWRGPELPLPDYLRR
jgi:hypothetical protein